MRLLSAGLIYVAVSTVAAVLLGEVAGRLNPWVSFFSLMAGAIGAVATFFFMSPAPPRNPVSSTIDDPLSKYRSVWLCLVGFVFAMFAIRSFCWLLFFSSVSINIQS